MKSTTGDTGNSQAGITFTGVGVRFNDGTSALEDITLSVKPGEIVAVVGPSGCGKSTLLRVASGLTACSTGACQADRRDIAHVFQDATLMPWRTVLRNVELAAELRGVGKVERRARAVQALDLVGLADAAAKYPAQLSGGMRMRVSLARALSLEPEVLLLDEPFGALDELTRETLQNELQRLFAERGCSAVFVTHSVPEAVYLADRVVCLSPRPGRIVAEFDIPIERPRNDDVRFSREFADICGRVSAVVKGHDPS